MNQDPQCTHIHRYNRIPRKKCIIFILDQIKWLSHHIMNKRNENKIHTQTIPPHHTIQQPYNGFFFNLFVLDSKKKKIAATYTRLQSLNIKLSIYPLFFLRKTTTTGVLNTKNNPNQAISATPLFIIHHTHIYTHTQRQNVYFDTIFFYKNRMNETIT